MEIKPVIYSIKPKYPDKYSIDIKNELMDYKPHRWMNKPLVMSALFAVILFSSCTTALGTTKSSTSTPSKSTAITKIPIFSQGEGTGVIGCVSINAPMFLTEEEAYTVISEELKNAGINVAKNNKVTSCVKVPLTRTEPNSKENKIKTKFGNLTYDGSIKVGAKKINIEFVSREDYSNWQDPSQEMFASVEGFNIKGAAESLANENSSVAAFYDPFTQYKAADIEIEGNDVFDEPEEAHEASVEFLRAQVKDFIQWLKAEGVI